jgi:ABC-type polysaccharide transport system permease subunit
MTIIQLTHDIYETLRQYWAVSLFLKDCIKYAIFLMELENKISKIQFNKQLYAPQSLCSIVIVVVIYKSFLSHFLVLD